MAGAALGKENAPPQQQRHDTQEPEGSYDLLYWQGAQSIVGLKRKATHDILELGPKKRP